MIQAYFNIFAIFAMMFVGYFLSYKKWFDSHTADVFSKMVLGLALPFEMFITLTQKFSRGEFLNLFASIVVPVLSIVLSYWVSKGMATLLSVDKHRLGTFSTMFTCSNTIFIGLPINMAIFGSQAVPYVLIYYIANTTFFWTWGIMVNYPQPPKTWCQRRLCLVASMSRLNDLPHAVLQFYVT